MDVNQALNELRSMADKDPQTVAKRRGVPAEQVLGVSTAKIRKLAATLQQDAGLAEQLWRSGLHEARILAILVAPPELFTQSQNGWVHNIDSWDLSDHLAKRVAEHYTADITAAGTYAQTWTHDDRELVRRAGLALLANFCMRQHTLDSDAVTTVTRLISDAASDSRRQVKQACCWALRELGKIDTSTHEAATLLALDLAGDTETTRAWVGRCAYKELENLVQVPERRRLISRHSQTAAKHHNPEP